MCPCVSMCVCAYRCVCASYGKEMVAVSVGAPVLACSSDRVYILTWSCLRRGGGGGGGGRRRGGTTWSVSRCSCARSRWKLGATDELRKHTTEIAKVCKLCRRRSVLCVFDTFLKLGIALDTQNFRFMVPCLSFGLSHVSSDQF